MPMRLTDNTRLAAESCISSRMIQTVAHVKRMKAATGMGLLRPLQYSVPKYSGESCEQ